VQNIVTKEGKIENAFSMCFAIFFRIISLDNSTTEIPFTPMCQGFLSKFEKNFSI